MASDRRIGMAKAGQKTHAVNADIALKVSQPATSHFDSLLDAAGKDQGIGGFGKALADHLAIAEAQVDFERFTQIGKCRVPSFKTSLGRREVRQQLRPSSWVDRALMRQGGLEIALRFFKCRSLKCGLTCEGQPTDQSLLVSEGFGLEEVVSDLPGAFVDGIGIEPLDPSATLACSCCWRGAEMPASRV